MGNETSIIKSTNSLYVKNFIKKNDVIKSDIIEIHNRPSYIKQILTLKKPKKILYFHNSTHPIIINLSISMPKLVLKYLLHL